MAIRENCRIQFLTYLFLAASLSLSFTAQAKLSEADFQFPEELQLETPISTAEATNGDINFNDDSQFPREILETRVPSLFGSSEETGRDLFDDMAVSLRKWLYVRKMNKDLDRKAKDLRTAFFTPGSVLTAEHLDILQDVMEQYARMLKYKQALITRLGNDNFEAEAADLDSLYKALCNVAYRQSFIARINQERGVGAGQNRVREISDYYMLYKIDLPAFKRNVGLVHLKRMIDNKEIDQILSKTGRAKFMLAFNDEDEGKPTENAEVTVRIVHNASQLSFVIYPKNKVRPDSQHLARIVARQKWDTERPSYLKPAGDSERSHGMDAISIGVDEDDEGRVNFYDQQVGDQANWDVHRKGARIQWPIPLPIPFTREWRDWVIATDVPRDAEKTKFGLVCGVLQFGLVTCITGTDWYMHPTKYNWYTLMAPALINYTYGAVLGTKSGWHRNMRKRGTQKQQTNYSQIVSLSCSSFITMAVSGPLSIFAWAKATSLYFNSRLNSWGRTAWGRWLITRDNIRYGTDPFEMKLKIPGRGEWKFRAKKLKKNDVFGQLVVEMIPWLPKTTDLILETPVTFMGIDLPSKILMLASIPISALVILKDLEAKASLPRYRENDAFQLELLKQREKVGKWMGVLQKPLELLYRKMGMLGKGESLAFDVEEVARIGEADFATSKAELEQRVRDKAERSPVMFRNDCERHTLDAEEAATVERVA